MSIESNFGPLKDISQENYKAKKLSIKEYAQKLLETLEDEERKLLDNDLNNYGHSIDDFGFFDGIAKLDPIIKDWQTNKDNKEARREIAMTISKMIDDTSE